MDGVLDNEGKAALSRAWQRYGCAVCGQVVQYENPDQGWAIELHRIVPGGRGGKYEVSNVAGLCGAFLNRCHEKVTEGTVIIAWEDAVKGYTWLDRDTGDEGLLRLLTDEIIDQLRLDRALPVNLHRERKYDAVPAVNLPASLHQEAGREGAEERFNVARGLVLRAERTWMALALVVQTGIALGDHAILGFGSPKEWADAMGIGKSTFSKLRIIAVYLEGEWVNLSQQDRDSLTIEKLTLAARMVRYGNWTRDYALSEAVAKPTNVLWQEFLDSKGLFEECVCVCGHRHRRVPEEVVLEAEAQEEATL
jgi:hypothetical protein